MRRLFAALALVVLLPTLAWAQPEHLLVGTKSVLFILVDFNDSDPTYTKTYAEGIFVELQAWFAENSYTELAITGDVTGWHSIAMSKDDCDYNTPETGIRYLADPLAITDGYDPDDYDQVAYLFPFNACSAVGISDGGKRVYLREESGQPGVLKSRLVTHELLHNWGLSGHARTLDCGATVMTEPCTTAEYGDPHDPMGYGDGHLSPSRKVLLGWLGYGTAPPITTVTTDGIYSIDALEPDGTSAKALKIAKGGDGSGHATWYAVEYRRDTGVFNTYTGIFVRVATDTTETTDLLDMTPATEGFEDAGLPLGTTFTDGRVAITALAADFTRASIQVTTTPCLQWTHSGSNVTEFKYVIDGGAAVSMGMPLRDGTTYAYPLPALADGAHTVVVQACNAVGCTAASAFTVVKMEP